MIKLLSVYIYLLGKVNLIYPKLYNILVTGKHIVYKNNILNSQRVSKSLCLRYFNFFSFQTSDWGKWSTP